MTHVSCEWLLDHLKGEREREREREACQANVLNHHNLCVVVQKSDKALRYIMLVTTRENVIRERERERERERKKER